MLDKIKLMYKSAMVSLVHQDKISQTLLTIIALKQGDLLSRIIFNIYINDLPGRLHEDSPSSDTINDILYLDGTKKTFYYLQITKQFLHCQKED